MKRNRITNVYIHTNQFNHHSLADKISQFHADIIERRLQQSELSTDQKTKTIDKIIVDLKLREVNGIIK